ARLARREGAYRRGRLRAPAAGEDGEAAAERARIVFEQLVAPVDRRVQDTAARQLGVKVAEPLQALAQLRGDGARRDPAHAGRGELERERDAGEQPADRADRRGVALGECEV